MAEKKYYWLKMTDQFFEDKAIKKLRKIAGGDTYTIIYLKMLLTAIKQGNKMYFEGIEDDFMEELALELDEDTDNVKVTVSYLKSKGLIEVLLETGFQETDIAIPVFKSYDGDTAQVMGVPLNIGEIQEVFSIMQMNVEEATKAIEAAKSENMLIVIHACDSRAGVKKAAQKKAGNLSSTNGSTNDPAGGNEFVDHSTQDETPSEK